MTTMQIAGLCLLCAMGGAGLGVLAACLAVMAGDREGRGP